MRLESHSSLGISNIGSSCESAGAATVEHWDARLGPIEQVETDILAALSEGLSSDDLRAEHFTSADRRYLYRLIEDWRAEHSQAPSPDMLRIVIGGDTLVPKGIVPAILACLDAIDASRRSPRPYGVVYFDAYIKGMRNRFKRQETVRMLDDVRRRIEAGEDLDGLSEIRVSDAWDSTDEGLQGPECVATAAKTSKGLREPILDGLARPGEVINFVSSSKAGKTWLLYCMAISLADGRDWAGFGVSRPRNVLLIDNELHRETLIWRLEMVAKSMGIKLDDLGGRLRFKAVRGMNVNVHHLWKIARECRGWKPDMVGLDSLYRFLPPGTNENDNGAMKDVMEQIINFADDLQAAVGTVAHSSKGDQSDKSITDVGSGAGSISRAADSHVVLRPHVDKDCSVMEACARSFPQPEARVLRWSFPLWVVDDRKDPSQLKNAREAAKDKKDEASVPILLKAAADLIAEGSQITVNAISARCSWNKEKVNRIAHRCVAAGHLFGPKKIGAGNVFSLVGETPSVRQDNDGSCTVRTDVLTSPGGSVRTPLTGAYRTDRSNGGRKDEPAENRLQLPW